MIELKQSRIAFVGLPDSGKSRFIQEFVKWYSGRNLSPDTLMDEVHYSDGKDPYGNPDTRTIKAAKIIINKKGWGSLCLMDAPGHFEYIDQIRSCVREAHHVYALIDCKRLEESTSYIERLIRLCDLDSSKIHKIYCRDDSASLGYNFDSPNGYANFVSIAKQIDNIDEFVDLEKEALDRLSSLSISSKDVFLYSGGKDSVVGLHLLSRAIPNDKMPKILTSSTDFDFPQLSNFIELEMFRQGREIERIDGALGCSYEDTSAFDMMMKKAEANEKMLKERLPEFMFVNYRASDEGVRSKDNWFRNCGFYSKISAVFNFSEVDIWKYIKKYNLPICSLYFQGYRSLGDMPITKPCMPHCSSVDEIISYLEDKTETTERDGRVAQDKSESFAMERLRNNGFF